VLDESGEPILGGIDQLAAAQQELIRLRGKYSEDHPSIINLRKEIASLSSNPVNSASLAEQLRSDLSDRRQELSAARQVYSDTHPDVVTLQQNVRSLQRQLSEVEAEIAAMGPGETARPNNPVYVQTRTRIDAAEEELTDLRRRHSALTARVNNLDAMRITAPQVESRYTTLMQEQGVLQTQYLDLRTLEGEASMGEALETGKSGERLTIIQPARVPGSPISPNRVSLSFLGVVLAIAIGLGVASLTDAMDTTVRGRNDVYQLIGAPPMGIIPYVENTADKAKRISINVVMTAATLGAISFIINSALS
jgi:succinoglycan biosynthesis transport protein ExoP